jgi:hypothetical protein
MLDATCVQVVKGDVRIQMMRFGLFFEFGL